MNTLETYIKAHAIDEVLAMNLLQEHGKVSDNAILAADVAETDCPAAIAFLTTKQVSFTAPDTTVNTGKDWQRL